MNKKLLSLKQMVNLNFGFLGIQFGWALQMANMSGIYKFLGASEANIGYLWLAAPISGMLVQPILGQISDRTWTKLGRRRPYILGGAIFCSLALLLMPNSSSLLMAAALLWLLDGSINATMQPYRALVADVSPDCQHTKCYAVQTALVGIGSTLAYALPWLFLHLFHLRDDTIASGGIPLTIKLSFYIGAAVLLAANLLTVFSSSEYPPAAGTKKIESKKSFWVNAWDNLADIVAGVVHFPRAMREIAAVQFFSWMAMFCIFSFFSLAIAQNVFGLPAGALVKANPVYQKMLEQGIAFTGVCFAAYTCASVVWALILPYLSNILHRKGAYILSLLFGGISLVTCNFIHTVAYLLVAMIGLGAAWASIVTVPYSILARVLPAEKMGLYMGLLNITICVPQIIAALILGFIVHFSFHNHAMPLIALAGISMGLAAICVLFVHDKDG